MESPGWTSPATPAASSTLIVMATLPLSRLDDLEPFSAVLGTNMEVVTTSPPPRSSAATWPLMSANRRTGLAGRSSRRRLSMTMSLESMAVLASVPLAMGPATTTTSTSWPASSERFSTPRT